MASTTAGTYSAFVSMISVIRATWFSVKLVEVVIDFPISLASRVNLVYSRCPQDIPTTHSFNVLEGVFRRPIADTEDVDVAWLKVRQLSRPANAMPLVSS